jgi:hypothetical protein
MYKGAFFNGERHGKGIYTYANGDVYKGGFFKGKLHGVGTYAVSNGDSFKTTWKSDLVHGNVSYLFANGDQLFGEYKNDVPVGLVRVIKKDGASHSFPWPDTAPKFVSDHAQAARDYALKLEGKSVSTYVLPDPENFGGFFSSSSDEKPGQVNDKALPPAGQIW